MDEDQRSDGLSRRRLLKRAGATAALAWSAPVLTSMGTPAFAASGPCACAPFTCPNAAYCPNSNCFCAEKLSGECFCTDVIYFNKPPDPPICANDADCKALGFPGIEICVQGDPECGWSGNVGCADFTCNLAGGKSARVIHR